MTAVIAGIDRVRGTDRAALEQLFARCSAETIRRRFFARLGRFPSRYLDAVLASRPAEHDAVVLRYGDGLHIAGLASLATTPDGGAELGVLVADAWQGGGLGAAMVEHLVQRAADRGTEEVSATVLSERAGLLQALARRWPTVTLARTADGLTGRYRVQ